MRPKRNLSGTGNVPPLLVDITDPGWGDAKRVAREAARYGAPAPSRPWESMDWSQRVHAFRDGWCTSHGLGNQYGQTHCANAREAGVDIRGTSRFRSRGPEWMRSSGFASR